MPPQWLVLPDVTIWPKVKCAGKIWLIGHYVHYVVRNGSSVTLHDYVDFLQRACKKAEEIRKKDHNFVVYLEKCTWGDIYSLRHPFLFTP